MSNGTQRNIAGPAPVPNAPTDEQALRSRGLRTLALDMAELKKQSKQPAPEGPPQGSPRRAPAPRGPQKNAPQMQKTGPARAPAGTPQRAPAPTSGKQTNYKAELERLAEKYIPEKGGSVPAPMRAPAAPAPAKTPQKATSSVSSDALKSFEMNKAFNDQLHKVARQETEPQAHREEAESKLQQPKPVGQPSPAVAQTQATPTKEEKFRKEMRGEAKEAPEKKEFTSLTEKDIEQELARVLSGDKEKKTEELKKEASLPQKEEQKREEPRRREPTLGQLEENLSDLARRLESSTSRIATYRDEEKETNTSLKNLFERRDIINKNLDPLKEKERAILSAIKGYEEKEAAASNKIEKRDAENKRWENENERRELEDERWRLEEIQEKLRLVTEKTEHELVSIKKKLAEEEAHKQKLESERRATETHRDLLTKRNEKEQVERERNSIQDEITNYKNELKVVRSTEEGLEKNKKEIESKIGGLNDLNIKRGLEKERRDVEDKLRDTEEKRWKLEDELKKCYGQKDEKDREVSLLSTELTSIENKFKELERGSSEKKDTDTK